MGPLPRRLNDTELGPEWLQQWADAELVEQVELLEEQVASLKAERDRLKVELHFSRGWAEESIWREEVGTRGVRSALAARAADEPASIARSPFATLEEEELGPIVGGRLRFLIGIVVISWGLIASFVYLVWQIAS